MILACLMFDRLLFEMPASAFRLQIDVQRYDLAVGNIGQLSALMYSTFGVRNMYNSVPESLSGSSMLTQKASR